MYEKEIVKHDNRFEYKIFKNNTLIIHQEFNPNTEGFVDMLEDEAINFCNLEIINLENDSEKKLELLIPSKDEILKAERQIVLINDLQELGVI